MLKKKIGLLLGAMLVAVSIVACSESNNNDLVLEKYPLMDFAVKVGDSYYHGKIDQTTHRVVIGTIENGNTITGVDYTLMTPGAQISPNPSSFIEGGWAKEQKVTVTTEEGVSTVYTIVLSKLNEETTDLIFIDNFDKEGVPDPKYWSLCQKGTSDWDDEMSGSNDQAYVKEGNLVLIGEKVGNEYKAGGIESINKFSFTFGKVEVRARITQYPNGAFPAIWLMPQKAAYQGWPKGGEIDIMEHIKQEAVIWQTVHTNYTYTLGIKTPPNSKGTRCSFGEYNVYGVEWNADELIFSVNGQTTFTYRNLKLADEAEKMQWPFTKDSSFYFILNMGLGGNREGSWAGPMDDANLPAKMEIDWVKVSRPAKQ